MSGSTVVGGAVSGADYVGGLIGFETTPTGVPVGAYAQTVSSSSSSATVSGSGLYVGGLVGWNGAPVGATMPYTALVSTSYSTANVVQASSTGPGDLGGLVGWNGANSTIEVAYATGSVTGGPSSVATGGLVGYNQGRVFDAFAALGAVTGETDVGGLIGDNAGTVTNAYSTDAVSLLSGGSNLGGSIGINAASATLTAVYFDSDTAGTTTGTGANASATASIALTDAEAQEQASYVGFDFNNTWSLAPGEYPALKALPDPFQPPAS